MSTILKALRRLEEDKEREADAERLHGEVVAPATPDTRRSLGSWSGLIAIALVAVGAGAGVFAALSSNQAAEVTGAASREAPGAATPSRQEPSPSSISKASEKPPAPRPVAAAARREAAAPRPSPPGRVAASAAPRAVAPVEAETSPPAARSTEAKRRPAQPTRRAAPARGSPSPAAPVAPPAGAPESTVATLAAAATSNDEGTPVEDLPIASESSANSEQDPWEIPVTEKPAKSVESRARPAASASKPRLETELAEPRQDVAESAPPRQQRLAPSSMPSDVTQPAQDVAARATRTPAAAEGAWAKQTTPALVQSVMVRRTIWHPNPKRRAAFLSVDAEEPVKIREGESYLGLRVKRISPSGVVFDRDGEEISRRVGEES